MKWGMFVVIVSRRSTFNQISTQFAHMVAFTHKHRTYSITFACVSRYTRTTTKCNIADDLLSLLAGFSMAQPLPERITVRPFWYDERTVLDGDREWCHAFVYESSPLCGWSADADLTANTWYGSCSVFYTIHSKVYVWRVETYKCSHLETKVCDRCMSMTSLCSLYQHSVLGEVLNIEYWTLYWIYFTNYNIAFSRQIRLLASLSENKILFFA